MFKNPCSRCTDENGYIKAYNHIQGGVCFKCKGDGYVLTKTDPVILEARREKAAAIRNSKMDEKIDSGILTRKNLFEKYKDDPRISDEHKERCERFELVALETYKALERSDKGTYKFITSFPWYVSSAA
jgi:hypothetical protein